MPSAKRWLRFWPLSRRFPHLGGDFGLFLVGMIVSTGVIPFFLVDSQGA